MAKARALDKRRRSVRNIRKITRTMELIATARFKKAMDRGARRHGLHQAYYQARGRFIAGRPGSQPSAVGVAEKTNRVILLVLTGNRGLCGGYNSNIFRAAWARYNELKASIPQVDLEISGKRGIAAFKFRGLKGNQAYTQFEDKPSFAEVNVLATRYLDEFITHQLDRLEAGVDHVEPIKLVGDECQVARGQDVDFGERGSSFNPRVSLIAFQSARSQRRDAALAGNFQRLAGCWPSTRCSEPRQRERCWNRSHRTAVAGEDHQQNDAVGLARLQQRMARHSRLGPTRATSLVIRLV